MKHAAQLLFVFVALFYPATLSAQSGRKVRDEANKICAEADRKLNTAYEELIKSVRVGNGTEQADLLVARLHESQRAWLKYRDAQVAFVAAHANVGSGSARAAGMAIYSADLTNKRIKDLRTVPNPF